MTEKKIPAVDEVLDAIGQARDRIAGFTAHESYTIEDYPIGSRNRGLCKLEVESKHSEYRTVRTTTNKHGVWCKPKKSTYRNELVVVITGCDLKHESAWLCVGKQRVYLQYANGSCETLASAPYWRKPDRAPVEYTVTTKQLAITAGGITGDGETRVEHKSTPADPPELCDAYDAWEQGLEEVVAVTRAKVKEAQQYVAQEKAAG